MKQIVSKSKTKCSLKTQFYSLLQTVPQSTWLWMTAAGWYFESKIIFTQIYIACINQAIQAWEITEGETKWS